MKKLPQNMSKDKWKKMKLEKKEINWEEKERWINEKKNVLPTKLIILQ